MIRKFSPFAGKAKTFSWWWFGIKVGIVTALVIWWWLENQNKEAQKTSGEASLSDERSIPLPDEEMHADQKPKSPAKPTTVKPDDLRKIAGIGPKIQSTLQAAGIQTYAQLAAADPADLKQILVDAGIRLGNPTTWPEQANLAAAEKWDQLKELQETLKGGRR
jgi:predicted flap endonuclease-1-like 5' DNA nuclease